MPTKTVKGMSREHVEQALVSALDQTAGDRTFTVTYDVADKVTERPEPTSGDDR